MLEMLTAQVRGRLGGISPPIRILLAVLAVPLALAIAPAPALATAPPNDDFVDAAELTGLPATASGNNISASKETGEPDHGGDAGGASVWYSWTAPSSGRVVARTCPSPGFDTTLGVYTGDAVNALATVKDNDDGCDTYGSRAAFNATQGATYRIAVDGLSGVTGSFTLVIEAAVPLSGDSIVWANYNSDSISFANLNGGHGGDIDTGAATVDGPWGVALDPAADKIWWLNYSDQSIASADLSTGVGSDLDTTGATINQPYGFALDPVAGIVYWANFAGSTISYARTDGSGGNTFDTGSATVSGPCGVAVDRPGNRLWWANYNDSSISYASLDGGGGHDLDTGTATISGPCGVAVDRSAGRVWWSDSGVSISSADIDGGDGLDLDLSPATAAPYYGLALDPAAEQVWWPGYDEDMISTADMAGGGDDLDVGSAPIDYPTYPSIIKRPAGTGVPMLAGTNSVGSDLSCTEGSWAGDLAESFLFRAPRSFAYGWTRDGDVVAGATSADLQADEAGQYRCSVTATNAVGSSTQKSAALKVKPSNDFTIGKAKRNEKKGTASLKVKLPGAGKVSLSGKGVKKAKKTVAKKGTVKLPVKPKGKASKKLKATGKVKVKVKVKFVPKGGSPNTESAKVKLRMAG